jgi:cysteine desulfuration protein SufE
VSDAGPHSGDELPPTLADIAHDFAELAPQDRLMLLLDFSANLPDLPPRYEAHRELMESVPECQSPVYLATEVEARRPDGVVHLFFHAPKESPTTRGFAGILAEGLEGMTATEVLAVPADLADRLSLSEVVSPLRLRGLAAMLDRVQRQVRRKSGA